MLILDPIQAYLGGTMDMNRANEARDYDEEIELTGRKIQMCNLLIGHMNKKLAGNKVDIEEWVRLILQ